MMNYNSRKQNRRSIRLKGYDYSQTGSCFVTVCTQNQACLFGNILQGKMAMNNAGKMVQHWYSELENRFSVIHCDSVIIMPNHIHFIITNTGLCNAVGVDRCVRPEMNEPPNSTAKTIVESGRHEGLPLRVGSEEELAKQAALLMLQTQHK